ncbi:MAG: leucine-rich repeat protein [Mogibacterium sp.]|nr:leucine-rich repeat protein [Mogibacterium sp.]MBQ6502156.1 leucine-rich repeat protein [Mogibacterium sp.]
METMRREAMKRVVHASVTVMLMLLLVMPVGMGYVSWADTDFSTETKERYPTETVATCARYPALQYIVSKKDYIIIPGLLRTHIRVLDNGVLKDDACRDAVPQGVTVVDDYLLLSAYCGGNKNPKSTDPDEKGHPSVLYVIDKASGKYITTITLYEYEKGESAVCELDGDSFAGHKASKNHVGGIAYDGSSRLYIAKSNDRNISIISKSRLISAIEKAKAQGVDGFAMSYDDIVTCDDYKVSFLTWYNDKLFVGVFNKNVPNGLYGFTISGEDGNLESDLAISYPISGGANGAAFYEINGRECLATTSAHGRKHDSELCLYEVSSNASSSTSVNLIDKLTIPPMAEEITIDDGLMYTAFESGAALYSNENYADPDPKLGLCKSIYDRIAVADVNDVFYWADDAAQTADESTLSTAGAVLDSSTVNEYSGNLIDKYTEVSGNYARHTDKSPLATGFMYSDSLLLADSTAGGDEGYTDLTKAGVALMSAAYQNYNVSSMLTGMGYTKINQYNYSVKSTYEDNDRVAFSIAQKVIYKEGKRYVLYVVPIRGTYDAEWYSDFNLGTSGTHEGFKLSYDQIIDVLKKDFFETDNADSSTRKIFITGHSRGAAVGNLLAGKLTEGSYIDQSGVFAYTFACPAVSKTASISYKNIYNFNYKGDVIPALPLDTWDYMRYGTTIEYEPDSNAGRRFLAEYGEAFAGKPDTPAAVVDAIQALVQSEADFYKEDNLLLMDTLSYIMNENHTEDEWDQIVAKHGWEGFNAVVETINSYATGAAWFEEVKIENDAWTELNSEIPAGRNNWNSEYKKKEEYGSTIEERWNHWKTDHTELIRKIEKYTSVTINEVDDLDEAEEVVNKRMLMYKSKPITLITDVLVVFAATDNKPLDAITHGHTPENYMTAMNSRYFGFAGWAGSDTSAVDLTDTKAVITGVGANCFSDCSSLKAITIPDGGIEYAGSKAFAGLDQLSIIHGELRINSLVGAEAFNGCSGIEEIILGDRVENIPTNTFNGCSGLKKVTMPISATYTCYDDTYVSQMTYGTDYYYSFNGCSNVEEIHFTGGNGEAAQYSWADRSQYNSSGYGYTITGSYKYALPYLTREKLTTVVIEDGVREIPKDFLQGCGNLTELSLPDTLEVIGENAFAGCKLSSSTAIPGGVESIGAGAFAGCTGLVSATVPEGVSVIPSSVFSGCTNLTSITLPGYLDAIGSYAFSDSGITSIVVPTGVKTIAESCFENCSALRSISLPETLTSIQGNAFTNAGLTEIVIPDKVETIATDGFKNCSSLQKVTMPISVKYSCLKDSYVSQMTYGTNYYYSFSGCSNVREMRLTKGSGETTQYNWNDYSHYNSSGYGNTGTGSYEYALPYISRENLTTLTVDEGITELPVDFMRGCSNLENVSLPSTLKIIGASAFAGCKLSRNTVIPAAVESIGASAFGGCTGLTSVSIANVSAIPSGVFSGCTSLTDVEMPETATEVGSSAFSNSGVKNVAVPEGVTTLPESSFEGCGNLVKVTLPETLTSIGGKAFQDSSLQEIVIPDKVETIATDAFKNCSGLKKISLPISAKYSCYQGTSYGTMYTDRYDYYSFSGCGNVEEIHFTKGSGEAMQYSWNDSSSSGYTCRGSYTYGLPYIASGSLTTVIIEDGVTEIPANLLSGCGNVETLTLPDTLKIIGSGAFSSCSKITAVVLGDKIETIDSGAFPKSMDIYTVRDCAADTFAQSNGNNVYYLNDPQIIAESDVMAPEETQQLSFTYVADIDQFETPATGGWKIVSATSSKTTITDKGLLTIGEDEAGPVTVEVTYKGHTSSHKAEFRVERDTRKEALKKLNTLIAECEQIAISDVAFTVESFTAFTDALTAAKAVAANESSTEEEFIAARADLLAAKEALKIQCSHEWGDWIVTKEVSCTEDGSRYRICSKCGETENEVIPSEGHKVVVTEGHEATCTESGLTDGEKCSVCGEIFTEQTEIPALGHNNWSEWEVVTAATEDAEGLERRTCGRCGETEDRAIPPIGHQHRPERVEAKDAGCTEDGNYEYWICTGCGHYFSDEQGTAEINIEDTVIPAPGHDPVKVDRVEPTDETDGCKAHWSCSRCGKLFSDETCKTEVSSEDLRITKEEQEKADKAISNAEDAVTAAETEDGKASAQANEAEAAAAADKPDDEVIDGAVAAADEAVKAAQEAYDAAQKALKAAEAAYGEGSSQALAAENLAASARELLASTTQSEATAAKAAATSAGKKAAAAKIEASAAAATPGQAAVNAANTARKAADEAAAKAEASKAAADAALEAAKDFLKNATEEQKAAAEKAVATASKTAVEAEYALNSAKKGAEEAAAAVKEAQSRSAAAAAQAKEAERQGKLNTTLPKLSISKPAAAKKAVTVKWKKLAAAKKKKAQKIEIWVCPNKSFGPDDTVIKTISKGKASYKVKGLKAKTKYYIKIRTIKKINGVKNVSKWSKTKNIKTK